jgi:hypothetical protein
VRNEAGSLPNAEFVPLGKRRLRGLVGEVELFAAVKLDAGIAAPRWIDPVCSMELTVDQVAARLALGAWSTPSARSNACGASSRRPSGTCRPRKEIDQPNAPSPLHGTRPKPSSFSRLSLLSPYMSTSSAPDRACVSAVS